MMQAQMWDEVLECEMMRNMFHPTFPIDDYVMGWRAMVRQCSGHGTMENIHHACL